MALSSFIPTLLMICLAAAVAYGTRCTPRSQGETTSDGLFLQKIVVTNTRNPFRLIPNARPLVKPADAAINRHFFRNMFNILAERKKLEGLERTPITITVVTLMDAILGEICSYMRSQFNKPDLNCTSSEEIEVLSKQLETMEVGIKAYDTLNFGAHELELDFYGEVDSRYTYWQRNIRSPCLADDECDVTVVDRLYQNELRGVLFGGVNCTAQA